MNEPAVITLEAARSLGLKKYFTGIPCKAGHVCERFVCGRRCIECTRKSFRRRYVQKGPQYNARKRQKYAENPERAREASRLWRLQNQEKRTESYKKWLEQNQEYHSIRYLEIREDHLEACKLWRKNNPEKARLIAQRRRARERSAQGDFTVDEVHNLLRLQKGRCVYCRKAISRSYHIDHIEPLSKGGAHEISNIQLLCASCNCRKHAKDPFKFALECGMLL